MRRLLPCWQANLVVPLQLSWDPVPRPLIQDLASCLSRPCVLLPFVPVDEPLYLSVRFPYGAL